MWLAVFILCLCIDMSIGVQDELPLQHCIATATTACTDLDFSCLKCTYNNYAIDQPVHDCSYLQPIPFQCTVADDALPCQGPRTFEIQGTCQMCYQRSDTICTNTTDCNVHLYDSNYLSNCTVPSKAACLGTRRFRMQRECNWSSGKTWAASSLFSLFLGGFGAGRYYLGQVGLPIVKFFTFGGIGVWAVVDAVLAGVYSIQTTYVCI
eukprot:m.32163 g.32163  ORF g.32163 m.32163 type:complete len:208 (-) comp9488_c0_seq3:5685-6308(-)